MTGLGSIAYPNLLKILANVEVTYSSPSSSSSNKKISAGAAFGIAVLVIFILTLVGALWYYRSRLYTFFYRDKVELIDGDVKSPFHNSDVFNDKFSTSEISK